jgi:hypothetical protein
MNVILEINVLMSGVSPLMTSNVANLILAMFVIDFYSSKAGGMMSPLSFW